MRANAGFDPERLASYEAEGWRAYYERRWPRLLRLTVDLCQEQFGIPFPRSLLAAYHVVRAAVAWVPLDHTEAAVARHLTAFYRLAARSTLPRFDPERVAALELRYFDVHRRLVGQADKTELIEAVTDLHAALFGLAPAEVRESAELRVRAMNIVDGITGGESADVEGDWLRIERDLRRCYRLLARRSAGRTLRVEDRRPAIDAADYHFVTRWRVAGTAEEIAAILGDALALPRWWPSVYLDVRELVPGDERGVGRVVDLHTKGWLPYTLRWRFTVTESRHPHGFTLVATGDLAGQGVWTLEERGGWTDVTYDWRIRADNPLLKYGSALLKPIFSANHHWAMARGEESLRLELARRRARTPAAQAAIPAPPPPTTAAPILLLAGAAVMAGLAYVGARRLARRYATVPDRANGRKLAWSRQFTS